jgi:hypothetical protein
MSRPPVRARSRSATSFAAIGAIVVKRDGTRVLAQVTPDPLAKPDEQG